MTKKNRKEPVEEYGEVAHARGLLRGALTLVERDGNRDAICELIAGAEHALDHLLDGS